MRDEMDGMEKALASARQELTQSIKALREAMPELSHEAQNIALRVMKDQAVQVRHYQDTRKELVDLDRLVYATGSSPNC
jgi:hypothetical protein